jgi:hypothetical protein
LDGAERTFGVAIVTDRLFPKKKVVSVLSELFKTLEAQSKIKGIIQKV